MNGFSFVKKSSKYYDDASQILVEIMIKAVRPDANLILSTRAPLMRNVTKGDGDHFNGIAVPRGSTSGGAIAAAAAAAGKAVKYEERGTSLSVSGVSSLLGGAVNATSSSTVTNDDGRSSPSPSLDSVGGADNYSGDKDDDQVRLVVCQVICFCLLLSPVFFSPLFLALC